MFRLWIEWDFGQDNYIFTSKEKAKEWFNKARVNDSLSETWDELEKAGLIGLIPVEVI